MNSKAIFYHAGCPVCINAEQVLLDLISSSKTEVEVVHLSDSPTRITEASNLGVQSVPALVYQGTVLHINHGADLSALAP